MRIFFFFCFLIDEIIRLAKYFHIKFDMIERKSVEKIGEEIFF